ncbi:MAG: hypothetical protein H0V43_11935 [Gemmatimonadales bacterium]|nr:hypothetical protein [Gemmatimonadales bacterium]
MLGMGAHFCTEERRRTLDGGAVEASRGGRLREGVPVDGCGVLRAGADCGFPRAW